MPKLKKPKLKKSPKSKLSVSKDLSLWECSCGFTKKSSMPPAECPNCFKLDSFDKVPKYLVESKESEILEEDLEDEI
jgi:hypothetical protein